MGYLTYLAALAALSTMAIGQNITPTNWTDANQIEQVSDSIGVSVSVGNDMMPLGPILALTGHAHTEMPPTGLSGPVFLLDASTQLELTNTDVALISCDPYPGEIQSNDVFDEATKTNVTAIIFYSRAADYCNLTDYNGGYEWIYTTKSRPETTQLLDRIDSPGGSGERVYVSINTLDTSRQINGTSGGGGGGGGGGNQNGNETTLGPSPSTAVAMIILYSITGIITALFLLIIITGAVRAHRHPERYGPRNLVGRPRQSRARGLARAIVETLPIVKFGEQPDPKPTDVELADTTNTSREATPETTTPSSTDDSHQPSPDPETDTGIAAAATSRPKSISSKPESQGCSICTEDFEPGQDQRVLPCDHRFHPACIDPWLLNVSGTCPLCRIDLRPPGAETEEGEGEGEVDGDGNRTIQEGEGQLAPPLSGEGAESQRLGIRRSLLIGLVGSRGAERPRAERMTREERVRAARQLRRQHLARLSEWEQHGSGSGSASAETEEREGERRMRDRLRRVFGVRTRSTGNGEEGYRREDGGDG